MGLTNLEKEYKILLKEYMYEQIRKKISKKVNKVEEVLKQIDTLLHRLCTLNDEKQEIVEEILTCISSNLSKQDKGGFLQKNIKQFITNLLEKQEFYLYSHLFSYQDYQENRRKKMPLYITKCKREEGRIKPIRTIVNTNTITILLAIMRQMEFLEVEVQEEKTKKAFSKEIEETQELGELDHIYEIYDELFENYFNVSMKEIQKSNSEKGLQYIKNNLISIEELVSDSSKNIKEDLAVLQKILKDTKKIPKALSQYLFKNNLMQNDLEEEKYQRFHYGSYPSSYPIDTRQYQIINALTDNSLVAIEGPPGTGKTTMLKEIIANKVVERANVLLENWDKDWKKESYMGNYFYQIPWFTKKEVVKSIVVSSKNREAVSNVGDEINKEISYFKQSASEYMDETGTILEYQGMVCAKLGNSTNLGNFRSFLHNAFYQELQEKQLDLEQIKKRYQQKKEELDHVLSSIKTMEGVIGKRNYGNTIEEVIQTKKEIQDLKSQREQLLEQLRHKTKQLEQIRQEKAEELEVLYALKDTTNEELASALYQRQEVENKRQEYSTYQRSFVSKLLNYKRLRGLEQEDLETQYQMIQRTIQSKEHKLEKIDADLYEKEKESPKLQKEYNLKKQEEQVVKQELRDTQIKLNEIGVIETIQKSTDFFKWNTMLEIYGSGKIQKLNQELFLLALELNEAYVCKHRKEIMENLEIFMPQDSTLVFPKLYEPTYQYKKEKKEAILAVWNTLFLTFPVITTTLDSFCKTTFPMLPEYIDLELIDEAGQILPHNLITPLYRAKKAMIVGDVNQIEPIYANNRHEKEEVAKKLGIIYGDIKIENNSVQVLANKNSTLKLKKEVILLNKHYRCEQSIIEFSNQYIYHNKLIMDKKDNFDKPFYHNMVAFDVRGEKAKEHYNIAEIEACIKTVQHLIKQLSKQKEEISIGIITPFKKQAKKIADQLKEEGITNIPVGTTHTFQGKQADYIIFSQVIDTIENKNLLTFIGNKSNLLNVAVTRAKKQFMFIGNLECSQHSRNYIQKLIQYIQQRGVLYSLYLPEEQISPNTFKPEILDILTVHKQVKEDVIGRYIAKNFPENIVDNAIKHYELLCYAIQNAQKKIEIISPWLRSNVITDELIQQLKTNKEKGKSIKIRFGYKKVNGTIQDVEDLTKKLEKVGGLGYASSEEVAQIIQRVKQIIGNDLVYEAPTHEKILIIDESYMILGSHNWLSNAGKTNTSEQAREISGIITNESSIEYVRKRFL